MASGGVEQAEEAWRELRITSEDDLWLPRYLEGIPLQSEPDCVTMYHRRMKILSTPIFGPVQRSPSMHRRDSTAAHNVVANYTRRTSSAARPNTAYIFGRPTSPHLSPMTPPASSSVSANPPMALSSSLGSSTNDLLGGLDVDYDLTVEEDSGAWGEGMGTGAPCATTPTSSSQLATVQQSTPVRTRRTAEDSSSDEDGEDDPYATPYRSTPRGSRLAEMGGASPAPSPMSSLYQGGVRSGGSALRTQLQGLPSPFVPPVSKPISTPSPRTTPRRGPGPVVSPPPAPRTTPPVIRRTPPPPVVVTPLLLATPAVTPQPGAAASSSSQGTSGEFDWNLAFHEAMEGIGKLTLNTHSEDRLAAYMKLSQLASDFCYTVRTYARIIISEVYLPKEQKTVKPLESLGLAGGEKYVVQKILFKFALDTKGSYGSDENAAKVANHDLKSLVHVLNCWEPGLHFPMMALVDYRGFRVVGMTLLPINGNDTLVHGSRDGGKSVRSHPAFEEKLRRVAGKLNLKPHLVGPGEGFLFYTPVDLEGHVGTDNRCYVVDFSKLFPAQTPNPQERFRPEFVKSYVKPLCCDSLGSVTELPEGPSSDELKEITQERKAAEEENQQELLEATRFLAKAVIPGFVDRLLEVPQERREEFRLVLVMHQCGINVTFLGFIYDVLASRKDEYWSYRVLVEMAARVIKAQLRALLRRKMKELLLPGEGAYRSVVISHLNLVLGSSPATSRHWSSVIVPEMIAKFPPFNYTSRASLLHLIADGAKRAGMPDGRCLLLKLITRMLGLRFASTTWREISDNLKAFDRYAPFTDTDLKEMKERVKEMNIAAHSAGFMLKVRAKLTGNPEERRRLLTLAVQQFDHALEGNPDNRVTLRNLGECLAALDNFTEAQDCYLRALQVSPGDTTTLFKYAIALDKAGRLDEAEECFLRSLEACPTHSNACYYYADFLTYHRKNFDDAERFYQRSIDIDSANRSACNNYAVFLATVRREHDKAEHYFLRALSGGKNITHILNYASFLLHIRRKPELANSYLAKAKQLRVSSKWS